MNRVSVKDASRELGMTPLTLRTLMASGKLNIGFYTKKPDAKRGHYVIYRRLLELEKERLGIE
jgi:hypothetical protein